MSAQPAKFKIGDRVRICDNPSHYAGKVPGPAPYFGTIELAPKTARGKKYLVRFDGGYWLNGRDCPQFMREDLLEAA